MGLRSHVEFVSDAFPPYPNEDEEINPGIWGKRLAEYLCTQLPLQGVTPLEPFTEDWGWEIPIQNEAFRMFVGCSNQLEPGGNRFLCFIEPSKPEVRKGFFKKIDARADIGRVSGALDAILRSNESIAELRWWDENEG